MDKRLQQLKRYEGSLLSPKVNVLRQPGEKGYLTYRVLRPIQKVRYKLFRLLHKPAPWLSPASILFFDGYLTKDMTGCEFGSGFSTLFFAPRVKRLISVEHNDTWFGMIRLKLQENRLDNVDYRFAPKNNPSDFIDETFEMEDNGFSIRRDYVPYFRAISDLEDGTLDFLLVDGRARPECVYYNLSKLKSGGLLILDNSERARYEFVFEYLEGWEMANTTNGLTDTTFWVKP